jgi:glyoxylase-like metal-dependent hydrolase (beta-lactamase superfamily II)
MVMRMPAVSDRVFRIQAPFDGNAVHLYLIRGEKLALIDSGAGDSPQVAIEPALRELGLQWSDLDYLLNTHGHVDHAGGNGELKAAAPHVKIHIHPHDSYLLAGPEAHLNSPTDGAEAMRLMGRNDLLAEREVLLRRVVGRSAGVDRELVDGDVVDLGNEVRLRVVHTPGHTAGSVCYFWESADMVFSGDAVQGHGWRAGAAPIYHDVVYVDSLNRIDALDAATLCMGHTFGWNGVLNDPVRRGPEVKQTLQASRDVSAIFDRAAELALQQCGPGAAFAQLAEAAFRDVVFDLGLQWDRRTTVPVVAARAISAHLYARGWQPVAVASSAAR